jgi:hypothetical protein
LTSWDEITTPYPPRQIRCAAQSQPPRLPLPLDNRASCLSKHAARHRACSARAQLVKPRSPTIVAPRHRSPLEPPLLTPLGRLLSAAAQPTALSAAGKSIPPPLLFPRPPRRRPLTPPPPFPREQVREGAHGKTHLPEPSAPTLPHRSRPAPCRTTADFPSSVSPCAASFLPPFWCCSTLLNPPSTCRTVPGAQPTTAPAFPCQDAAARR